MLSSRRQRLQLYTFLEFVSSEQRGDIRWIHSEVDLMFLARMMWTKLNFQTLSQFEPPKIDEYDRPLKGIKAIS